jgi:hypothetical protein
MRSVSGRIPCSWVMASALSCSSIAFSRAVCQSRLETASPASSGKAPIRLCTRSLGMVGMIHAPAVGIYEHGLMERGENRTPSLRNSRFCPLIIVNSVDDCASVSHTSCAGRLRITFFAVHHTSSRGGEMVDALRSGRSVLTDVRVRLSPSAPSFRQRHRDTRLEG